MAKMSFSYGTLKMFIESPVTVHLYYMLASFFMLFVDLDSLIELSNIQKYF